MSDSPNRPEIHDCLQEVHRKLKARDRMYARPELPYPKLRMKGDCCVCKNAKVNQLRTGEPVPLENMNHLTGHVHYSQPRAMKNKKGCCCSGPDSRER